MFLPKGVNFKGYKQLASYAKLWTGYRNTIAYVIMGTLVTLVVNIPASYALSRKQDHLSHGHEPPYIPAFPGRRHNHCR